jgi:hypothetical protein
MSRIVMRLSVAVVLLAFSLATADLSPAEISWASGPARTETLAVGPYIVDFNLYQDPPYVDTPQEVTVVPHDSSLQLQGHVTAEPGLGTDATPLRFNLTASGDTHGTLEGTIRMPVRGAWTIVIDLTGPEGSGTAQIAVTVAAPGAIPIWLGWLIGASPLALIAFWIWKQRRIKQVFLAKSIGASPDGLETNSRDRPA